MLEEFGSLAVLKHADVVATRKCRINCNETLSPPYRLSNGRQSRAAGEVVDARGFSFLRRGDGDRAAFGVFLERQRERQQQSVAAIDAQRAVELMRELDGFSSIAT